MDLVALQPLALETLVFRTTDGALHLTIIGKLTFALRAGVAEPIDPEPIRGDQLSPSGRSLRVATDLVPRRARADVTFAGTAYASRVGLTLTPSTGGAPLIDKTLRVASAPIPLTYEHAFGGPGSKTNPVGVDAPQILDATHDKRTAGLGPVPSSWFWRSRALGDHDAAAVESLRAVPRDLDFAFFNAAPPDQQVPFLRGDETLVLRGLVDGEAELSLTLPGLRVHARVELDGEPRDVPLVADALTIDGDARRVMLTFRADVPVAVEEPRGRVVATTAPLGETPSFGPEIAREHGRSTRAATHPARTTEHVPLINVSGMIPFTMPFRVRPPRDALIVIVKGTFELVDDAPATLAAAQEPPRGDTRHDEQGSLRYASDFAPFKPRADVFLVGHAYPAENDRTVAHVHLQLGEDLRRSIAVFGDRTWDALGGQTKPAPFDKIELRWERAFGGALSSKNPVGRGSGGVLLPNLERLGALITSSTDDPEPICFAPIDAEWRARRRFLGSYGGRWLATRFPFFPDDFNYEYFNAAPREQQIAWPSGGEPYALLGVTPGGGALRGRLPSSRPRAFAAFVDGRFVEVLLRIDTIHFDADERRVVLVHRGVLETNDEQASELSAVFVMREDEQPFTIEEAHERFLEETRARPAAPAPRPIPIELRAPPPKRKTIEAWVAEGLAGRDLSGADLRNLDLSGADLRGAILARCDLRGSTLRGANLEEVSLAGARADDVDFGGAKLARADLEGAFLGGARLSSADLTRANLAAATCSGAKLDDVTADGARLNGTKLDDAVLDRASLLKADLSAAVLDRASLVDAKLDDAKLYDARGEECRLDRASLGDARLDRAELPRASFVAAVAPGLVGESVNLEGANLLGCKLPGALLVRARLRDAVLSKADLRSAILRSADLTGAKLLRANARAASFEGANLERADVRGASLYQAETYRARTRGASLEHAHLTGTKLSG